MKRHLFCMNERFFLLSRNLFLTNNVICVVKRSSLENYASNNTIQHDTTRNNTTQHNRRQHETTQTQHDTTQVQQDTTRDNTSATRAQHEAKHSINFILIYLHYGCTLGTWYIKTEAALML